MRHRGLNSHVKERWIFWRCGDFYGWRRRRRHRSHNFVDGCILRLTYRKISNWLNIIADAHLLWEWISNDGILRIGILRGKNDSAAAKRSRCKRRRRRNRRRCRDNSPICSSKQNKSASRHALRRQRTPSRLIADAVARTCASYAIDLVVHKKPVARLNRKNARGNYEHSQHNKRDAYWVMVIFFLVHF